MTRFLVLIILFCRCFSLAASNFGLELPADFLSDEYKDFWHSQTQNKPADFVSGISRNYQPSRLAIQPTPEENPDYWAFYQHVATDVEKKLSQELEKYCRDQCIISDIRPWLQDLYQPEDADFGFESLSEKRERKYKLIQIDVTILVNQTYDRDNLQKMAKIFDLTLDRWRLPIHISWKMVDFPSKEKLLWNKKARSVIRRLLEQEVRNVLDDVCHQNCFIKKLLFQVEEKSIEDVDWDNDELLSPDGKTQLVPSNVNLDLVIDESFDESRLGSLEKLLTHRLQHYVDTPKIQINRIAFPQSQSNPVDETESQTVSPTPQSSLPWWMWLVIGVGAVILLFLFIAAFFYLQARLRYALQAPSSSNSLQTTPSSSLVSPQVITIRNTQEGGDVSSEGALNDRLLLRHKKEEILKMFIEDSRIPKIVFGKMLQEEQFELVAQYTTILGNLILNDLVQDTDYHVQIKILIQVIEEKTNILSEADQLNLLKLLDLKITAAKVQLLEEKGRVNFDFIHSRTAEQIYEICADENVMVQAVILSQLSSEKRAALFRFFSENVRQNILKVLGGAFRVSQDYLYHLAEALKQKARHRPGFSEETMRGVDLVQDLILNSNLDEQRYIFQSFDRYPTISNTMRNQLISLYTIQFIPDGLFLSFLFSLERTHMLNFIKGLPTELADNILSRIPEDFIESVRGDLDTHTFNKTHFIKTRNSFIQQMKKYAEEGMINLYEINQSLFSPALVSKRQRTSLGLKTSV